MSEKPAVSDGPSAPKMPEMPEMPALKVKNLAIGGAVIVAIWALVIASGSKIALGVTAALTVALAVAAIWVWRFIMKQQSLMKLAQKGTSGPEGREAALKELAAAGDKDVMNVVLRAQLEAQTDPDLALASLDKIDMKKVPALALDQVRGLKAQLLLLNGRLDDATALCADIQPSKTQDLGARGMLAATVAETWARTGRAKDAREMLATISPDDTAYAQSRVPLLFARVFANFAETKHGLVKKDLTAIAKENVNLLGRFLDPRFKTAPELMRLAQEVMMADPEMQKMARKMGGGGGAGGGGRPGTAMRPTRR
ncbi:MAG: hypothetical protein Q8S73_07455 [Deltaproteobacteria bacterium]|nr:hypothetical protein [Deltaproteobacteria bacterium]